MKGSDLLDKMELVDPEYVEEADRPPVKRSGRIYAYMGTLAAGICLLAGLGIWAMGENEKKSDAMETRPMMEIAQAGAILEQGIESGEVEMPAETDNQEHYGFDPGHTEAAATGVQEDNGLTEGYSQAYTSAAEEIVLLSADEFQARGYAVNLPQSAADVAYVITEENNCPVGQVSFLYENNQYCYNVVDVKSNAQAGLYNLDFGTEVIADEESAETMVGQYPAMLNLPGDGSGSLIWEDGAAGMVYELTMDTGATKELLLKAAEPLENHAQVHERAQVLDEEMVYGYWKYEAYDTYMEITREGTYSIVGTAGDVLGPLPMKIMEDCVILYNEYGGEDTVLYLTEDGKFVDAAGDELVKCEDQSF